MIFNIIMLTLVFLQAYLIFVLNEELKKARSADNRARDSRGRYVADNPNTPKNEAYK
jgi:hypothetical protein